MANEEIYQAIELIDKRIAKLTQLKQDFIDEFNLNSQTTLPLPFKHDTTAKRQVARKKPTNKDRIIDLLKAEGPLSRGDIVKKTGIPAGSAAGVFTDKKTFYSKDDKWHLVEEVFTEEQIVEK
ncbi:MAG: hypothetical protein WC769_02350 [Thermodesulfovibrionales bacterium]|jgi:hypothetical protein